MSATVTRDSYPEFLTPAEVCALTGYAERTIRQWAERGELAFIVTRGGQRRFHSSQFGRLFALLNRKGRPVDAAEREAEIARLRAETIRKAAQRVPEWRPEMRQWCTATNWGEWPAPARIDEALRKAAS